MIGVPHEEITADAAVTRVLIQIPAGLTQLGVEISSPEARLGNWEFHEPPCGPALLEINWTGEGGRALRLGPEDGSPAAPASADVNPEAVIWPTMILRLYSGDWSFEVPLRATNTELLKGYYQRESHQQQYVVEHPFFNAFHEGRLRTLGRIFREHIPPGSRVLDVGSGYSIFFMIDRDTDLDITCCDLDSAAMEKMRGLEPRWNWVVADAVDLPWEDRSFDAVYAGEIIEHVAGPSEALAEWKRVLRPNGVLILSTPNRDRLLARAKGETIPVHHEHIRELDLSELKAELIAQGFKVLKVTGVYLEFLINWWRPRENRVDLLTARFGHPRYRRLYRLSMDMGRLAPGLAFDLVLVCKKPK
jgi:ubiquinone/menaquinone biosynthesis C-methylase UbiE